MKKEQELAGFFYSIVWPIHTHKVVANQMTNIQPAITAIRNDKAKFQCIKLCKEAIIRPSVENSDIRRLPLGSHFQKNSKIESQNTEHAQRMMRR